MQETDRGLLLHCNVVPDLTINILIYLGAIRTGAIPATTYRLVWG